MLRGIFHRKAPWARALASLAFLAMAARALVPAGYMLAGDIGRESVVVLCTVHGPVTSIADGAGGPDRPDKRPSADQAPCLYAAAAHLAAPQAAPALAPRRVVLSAAASARVERARIAELAAPPPWPTGPPRRA